MSNIYLIGNAHIDPVWLWRWQDGYSEVLATFRSALDRMNDFPDFKFTSACAVYYKWVEETDPEMFSEIQRRVREGRWNIVGGWYLQPDCNIPCGESFARQGLIAQRYFREKFGTHAKCGYNVDSFGHNGSLPQILSLSGMNSYIFMRPMPEEGVHKDTLFSWQAADGSAVCAYRIPWYYAIDLTVMDTFARIKDKAEREGRDLMAFYGVGNHGGGPTIKLIDEINKLGIEGMVYSTPDEFFENANLGELPTVCGELQHHARGCYSLGSAVKMHNRRCESSLLAAEMLCVMAQKLVGAEYPKSELDKAWENLMFNQFHDITAGCTIKSACEDAAYLYGETMAITERVINRAMQKIAWSIDTLQGETLPCYRERPAWTVWQHEVLGTPIVVFNPHPWSVRTLVRVYADGVKVTDAKGAEIPLQLVRGEQTNGKDKYNTAFAAEVGAYGYAVYRLFTRHEGTAAENTLHISRYSMENSKLRMTLDPATGEISELYDKEKDVHIIKGVCRTHLLDESACDSWAHDKKELGEDVGTFSEPEISVLERGPVRARLRVTQRHGESVIQRDYSLLQDEDELRVDTKIHFREEFRTLKFSFPTEGESVTAQIPYGTAVRAMGTGEECCGAWLSSGSLGIANDSKHGYDTKDGAVRLSILRSALYADHFAGEERDEQCEFMEQGEHEFSYSLFAYTTPSNAERRARFLNFPPRAVVGTFHGGNLPEEMSCFECEGDVVVTAIKKSEDGDGAVLRFYEANGVDTDVRIRLFDRAISAAVGHNKIKTFSEDGKELDLIEW